MVSMQALVNEGFVGNLDALVQVRELAGDPNSGSGGRGHLVTLAGGLSFEVLPDRGLDIGSAWFEGLPVGWRSPLSSPGLAPSALGWIGRWGGGLVLTCGLDNVGSPRGIYGQHGSHHDTRAVDVALERVPGNGERGPGVRVRGVVDSVETFGRRVRLYREITSFAGDPTLRISDRIVNEGWQPAPVAIMYHCNFSAPVVLPGTRIGIEAGRRSVREEVPELDDCAWHTFPEPIEAIAEKVWEHAELPVSEEGTASATVSSPAGIEVGLTWDGGVLPRCLEWMFPSRGCWVLGVEPTNAPLFGPDREADDAGMPMLAPGDELVTGVTLQFSRR